MTRQFGSLVQVLREDVEDEVLDPSAEDFDGAVEAEVDDFGGEESIPQPVDKVTVLTSSSLCDKGFYMAVPLPDDDVAKQVKEEGAWYANALAVALNQFLVDNGYADVTTQALESDDDSTLRVSVLWAGGQESEPDAVMALMQEFISGLYDHPVLSIIGQADPEPQVHGAEYQVEIEFPEPIDDAAVAKYMDRLAQALGQWDEKNGVEDQNLALRYVNHGEYTLVVAVDSPMEIPEDVFVDQVPEDQKKDETVGEEETQEAEDEVESDTEENAADQEAEAGVDGETEDAEREEDEAEVDVDTEDGEAEDAEKEEDEDEEKKKKTESRQPVQEMATGTAVMMAEIRKLFQAVLDKLPERCKIESEIKQYRGQGDLYLSGVGNDSSDIDFDWFISSGVGTQKVRPDWGDEQPIVYFLGYISSPQVHEAVKEEWNIPFDKDVLDYAEPMAQWIMGFAGVQPNTESKKAHTSRKPRSLQEKEITLTPETAKAAAWDAGNASMRKAGRTLWNVEDMKAASQELVRLMHKVEPDNPTWWTEEERNAGVATESRSRLRESNTVDADNPRPEVLSVTKNVSSSSGSFSYDGGYNKYIRETDSSKFMGKMGLEGEELWSKVRACGFGNVLDEYFQEIAVGDRSADSLHQWLKMHGGKGVIRGNTYNDSWWGPTVEYLCLPSTSSGLEGPCLVFLQLHGGGDVRGGYAHSGAFWVDYFLEDMPWFDMQLYVSITTDRGEVVLQANDLEAYYFTVLEDETNVLEVEEDVSYDQLTQLFDWGGNSLWESSRRGLRRRLRESMFDYSPDPIHLSEDMPYLDNVLEMWNGAPDENGDLEWSGPYRDFLTMNDDSTDGIPPESCFMKPGEERVVGGGAYATFTLKLSKNQWEEGKRGSRKRPFRESDEGIRYKDHWNIVPKKDFGKSGYTDNKGVKHTSGFLAIHDTEGNCLPGATWSPTLDGIKELADIYDEVGKAGFWDEYKRRHPQTESRLHESTEIERIPVLFRAERSGEFKGVVTAVFPTIPGDNEYEFTVYSHVGQHGAGTYDWYFSTRAATPEEYADLLAEVKDIYENDEDHSVKLAVIQKMPSNAVALRRQALKQMTVGQTESRLHESTEPEGSKYITVSYDIVTPESAEEGDVAESGWEDEEGVDMTPDEIDIEDGLSAVDKAVDYLQKNGPMEPSSSRFAPRTWYTHQEGQDPSDGSYTSYSYHLNGFTQDEELEIYQRMMGKNESKVTEAANGSFYSEIISLQDSEAEEPMRIFKEEGAEAAAAYLARWDEGESPNVSTTAPWGKRDENYKVTVPNAGTYILSVNKYADYIMLTKVLSQEEYSALMHESKWSANVDTDWTPPEGFFNQSAEKIAQGLESASTGLQQAMSRLNFYINRAGENLSDDDKKRLEKAKDELHHLYDQRESVQKESIVQTDTSEELRKVTLACEASGLKYTVEGQQVTISGTQAQVEESLKAAGVDVVCDEAKKGPRPQKPKDPSRRPKGRGKPREIHVPKPRPRPEVDESLGYRMKSGDQQAIDAFFQHDSSSGPNLQSDGERIVSLGGPGGYSQGQPLVVWVNDKVKIGPAFGNVSQTWVNAVRRAAKMNRVPVIAHPFESRHVVEESTEFKKVSGRVRLTKDVSGTTTEDMLYQGRVMSATIMTDPPAWGDGSIARIISDTGRRISLGPKDFEVVGADVAITDPEWQPPHAKQDLGGPAEVEMPEESTEETVEESIQVKPFKADYFIDLLSTDVDELTKASSILRRKGLKVGRPQRAVDSWFVTVSGVAATSGAEARQYIASLLNLSRLAVTMSESHSSEPESIAASLDQATQETIEHARRCVAIMNQLPEGTTIHSGRKTWTKTTVAGDIFWTDGKRWVSNVVMEVGAKIASQITGIDMFNPPPVGTVLSVGKHQTTERVDSESSEQPIRYDPNTNRHNGQKLVRGELIRDTEGKVYILDRDRGYFLNLDVAVQNPEGMWRPSSQSKTFSVDPTNKDDYHGDLFLMGKNVFESKPVVVEQASTEGSETMTVSIPTEKLVDSLLPVPRGFFRMGTGFEHEDGEGSIDGTSALGLQLEMYPDWILSSAEVTPENTTLTLYKQGVLDYMQDSGQWAADATLDFASEELNDQDAIVAFLRNTLHEELVQRVDLFDFYTENSADDETDLEDEDDSMGESVIGDTTTHNRIYAYHVEVSHKKPVEPAGAKTRDELYYPWEPAPMGMNDSFLIKTLGKAEFEKLLAGEVAYSGTGTGLRYRATPRASV